MPDLDRKLRSIFRAEIFEMNAYKVADAGGCIKLDAMENPYPWPPEMVEEWLDRLRGCRLNRYPDPTALPLKKRLKACNGVPEEAELLLGNGSDELIQILLTAVAGQNATVISPEPSFVMYRQIARTLGIHYVGIPLKEGTFALDMGTMRQAIETHAPAVVFLAYPNNPTGNLFAAEDLVEILNLASGLVVIDEAYAPFAEASFMERLRQYDHLLVMRTMSKLGLAGLRLGLLAGAPAILAELDKIRLPYNINILTQMSAEFALEKYPLLEEQARRIREERERLFAELEQFEGITAYPSRANFILFRMESAAADHLFQALRQAGVLVKNLSPAGGALAGCLRVTVGTPSENRAFLDALKAILTARTQPA